MSLSVDAPTKSVARIKDEGRLRSDESRTRNAGQQLSLAQCEAAFENTTDDAFLAPDLAGSEKAFRIQAGQLGAGAGATRRAVVLLARAEHEVPAVYSLSERGAVELDVINFRPLRALNLVGAECLAGGPGKADELFQIFPLDEIGVMLDQKEPVATIGDVSRHFAVSGYFH